MTEALSWDLSDLYPGVDSSRISDDLGRSRSLALDFAKRYRGRVGLLSPADLAEAMRSYEAMMDVAYRPSMYASLVFSGQTNDEKAQALMNRTRQATTEALNEVRFFDVELKKMPADAFDKLLAAQEL